MATRSRFRGEEATFSVRVCAGAAIVGARKIAVCALLGMIRHKTALNHVAEPARTLPTARVEQRLLTAMCARAVDALAGIGTLARTARSARSSSIPPKTVRRALLASTECIPIVTSRAQTPEIAVATRSRCPGTAFLAASACATTRGRGANANIALPTSRRQPAIVASPVTTAIHNASAFAPPSATAPTMPTPCPGSTVRVFAGAATIGARKIAVCAHLGMIRHKTALNHVAEPARTLPTARVEQRLLPAMCARAVYARAQSSLRGPLAARAPLGMKTTPTASRSAPPSTTAMATPPRSRATCTPRASAPVRGIGAARRATRAPIRFDPPTGCEACATGYVEISPLIKGGAFTCTPRSKRVFGALSKRGIDCV